MCFCLTSYPTKVYLSHFLIFNQTYESHNYVIVLNKIYIMLLPDMQLNTHFCIAGNFVDEPRQQEYSPASQNNDGAELSPHSRAATPLECFTYTTEIDQDNYQTLVRADARFIPNLALEEVRIVFKMKPIYL